MWLNIVLISIIFGAGYWFWLRPILMTTARFKDFYAAEAGYFVAFSAKFAGIKQKMAGAVIILASIYVSAANYVIPAMTGVDTTIFTKSLPDWVVPLIPILLTILLNYFRSLADKNSSNNGG
jgi:hypothetical protein